jgi:Ca2+-transporting ATPase
VAGIFALALSGGKGEGEARALAFSTLIIANLGLIFTNRSWTRTIAQSLRRRNPALWWIGGGAAALLGLVLGVGFLRELFRLAPLHGHDIAICIAAGLASVLWFEIFKAFGAARLRASAKPALE